MKKEKIKELIKKYPDYVMTHTVTVGIAWFIGIQLIQFIGIFLREFDYYNMISRAIRLFTDYSGEDFEFLERGHFSITYLTIFCVVFVLAQREIIKGKKVRQ